jgi:hypothetical protein
MTFQAGSAMSLALEDFGVANVSDFTPDSRVLSAHASPTMRTKSPLADEHDCEAVITFDTHCLNDSPAGA